MYVYIYISLQSKIVFLSFCLTPLKNVNQDLKSTFLLYVW